MKNQIEDLRNHLFATLEGLQDPDKPMELERAKVISAVAQTIINSAKVEIDYLELRGNDVKGTGFIPEEQKQLSDESSPGATGPRLIRGKAHVS